MNQTKTQPKKNSKRPPVQDLEKSLKENIKRRKQVARIDQKK